ncbi:MAG: potassium-transporting ATPase subunit C [Thermoplasmata archaeon]
MSATPESLPLTPAASPKADPPPAAPKETPAPMVQRAEPAPGFRFTRRQAGRHVRGAAVVLLLMIVVVGVAYPVVITGFAQLVTPGTANGSLITYNGTVVGSSLIAQNLSAPYLFWDRPSLIDYNITLGFDTDPGPSDPALAALINQTIAYMNRYGEFTVNASLPLDLVTPSASGVDPDLTPEAVLVQIPRVHDFSNLSNESLLTLVDSQIVQPFGGIIGPAFVNVLDLDIALLPLEGR